MKLTRRYRFPASHRLHTDALTLEENAELYGKCNNPYGHGHDYVLDVTLEGVEDASGQIVNREALDAVVNAQVISRMQYRNLNCDVAELRGKVTTTENLALVIQSLLEARWDLPARLAAVRVSETDRNSFELRIG
jgi:6-pyruvoyltetrahydropterin/6-carboxytetrahydropterin synthase